MAFFQALTLFKVLAKFFSIDAKCFCCYEFDISTARCNLSLSKFIKHCIKTLPFNGMKTYSLVFVKELLWKIINILNARNCLLNREETFDSRSLIKLFKI